MKLALAILFLATSLQAMDKWSALSMIESGDRDNVKGASGEVSRYGIMPAVWRAATTLPLSASTNRDVAWSVAMKVQSARVVAFARREGRMPTSAEWYRLWNRPARVLNPTPLELERSKRFENLVNSK